MNSELPASNERKQLRLQARIQSIQNCRIKLLTNRVDLYLANHFFGKAIGQQIARQVGMNPTSFQVKQFVFLNLPDGSPVGTLNVVSENFKLRLRVHTRLIRQQQVLVRLHSVSLLRIVTHKNFAVEDSARLAIKNTLVELVTGAMGLSMINN